MATWSPRFVRALARLGATLLLAGCTAGSEESALRIVGGELVSEGSPAAVSAVTLIKVQDGKSFCTGTLIAERLVVTAAHCVTHLAASDFEIGFGQVASSTERRTADVVRVAVEEKRTFKPEGDAHFPNFDIAWVKLREAAPAGSRPMEVWRDGHSLQAGDDILVAGFGMTATACTEEHEDDCRGVKREVTTVFRDYLNRGRVFSLFRLGPKQGSATCYGDSGGPAYVKKHGQWYLVGATNGVSDALSHESFVNGRPGCEGGSQIYTFVGDYAQWIAESANIALPADARLNPPGVQRVLAPQEKRERSFAQWLQYDNHQDPAWSTIQHVVDQAIRAQPDVRKVDYAHVLLEPEHAVAICREKLQYSLTDDRPTRIIEDLAPLATMDWVTQFKLANARIADFSPLAGLPHLQELEVVANKPLGKGVVVPMALGRAGQFAHLTKLSLIHAPGALAVEDWGREPVALETLNLTDMALGEKDFAAIHWSGFTKLQDLSISRNQIESVANLHIDQIPQLKRLKLDDNSLTSLAGLSSASLERLEVNNWIKRGTLTSLAGLGKLANLRTLIMSSQSLVDVSALAPLAQLEELFLYDNFLTDISGLSGLIQLRTLDVSYNRLENPECPFSPAEICELDPQFETILKDGEADEGSAKVEMSSDAASGAEFRK